MFSLNGTPLSTKAMISFLFVNCNFPNYSSNAQNNIYPMITDNDNNVEATSFKSNRRRSRLRKQCPDHQGHTMLTVTINTRSSSFQVLLESKGPVLTVGVWTRTRGWKRASKHGPLFKTKSEFL